MGVIVKSKSGRTARGNERGSIGGDFVIAKKAPFVPNAVLAFAACTGSWHAVQKVQMVKPRDTIQGFVNGKTAGGKKKCGSENSLDSGQTAENQPSKEILNEVNSAVDSAPYIRELD